MKEKKEEFALFVQIVLAVVTFFSALCSVYISEMLLVTHFMITLLLIDMAINNKLFYHHKLMTPIYLTTALFVLFVFVNLVIKLG